MLELLELCKFVFKLRLAIHDFCCQSNRLSFLIQNDLVQMSNCVSLFSNGTAPHIFVAVLLLNNACNSHWNSAIYAIVPKDKQLTAVPQR